MPLQFHKSTILKTLYLPFYGLLGWGLYEFVPRVISESITSIQGSYIIIWLILLSTLLANYTLELTRKIKINIKKYEFINPPGCYKHKQNGKYYCKPCLLKDKIESEISWINHVGMQCNVCGAPYKVSLAQSSLYPELEKQFDRAIAEWEKPKE